MWPPFKVRFGLLVVPPNRLLRSTTESSIASVVVGFRVIPLVHMAEPKVLRVSFDDVPPIVVAPV